MKSMKISMALTSAHSLPHCWGAGERVGKLLVDRLGTHGAWARRQAGK